MAASLPVSMHGQPGEAEIAAGGVHEERVGGEVTARIRRGVGEVLIVRIDEGEREVTPRVVPGVAVSIRVAPQDGVGDREIAVPKDAAEPAAVVVGDGAVRQAHVPEAMYRHSRVEGSVVAIWCVRHLVVRDQAAGERGIASRDKQCKATARHHVDHRAIRHGEGSVSLSTEV